MALSILLALLSTVAAASSEKIIYSFLGGSDGSYPSSGLIADSSGDLYGVTCGGGSFGYGTVFELKQEKGGWEKLTLYSFAGSPKDGDCPSVGVVFDKQGNLYGTTAEGGTFNTGMAFELSPGSHGNWAEKVIHVFGKEGIQPGSLVIDDAGRLYGTLLYSYPGDGAVFELDGSKGSWRENILHTFTGSPDGMQPAPFLFMDSAGNLYGTTEYGGDAACNLYENKNHLGCGTAFTLQPQPDGAWRETILSSFRRGGGLTIHPSGGLIFDTNGNLLGTSAAGGDGYGTVFKLEKPGRGWQQEVLWRFYGAPDGIQGSGPLTQDSAGNLFGVTVLGGAYGRGVAFRLAQTRKGWEETILHSFTAGEGGSPSSLLFLNGHLYGTTGYGGITGCSNNAGCGTVFEVTP